MSNDLIARLSNAQSDDERNWLVTENLLNTLSIELQSMVWAAAVPHWFNSEILAALRPKLMDQTELLYKHLTQLSFVELFPGRGHNIHEKTRKTMLDRLWKENPAEFRDLSLRAYDFFSAQDDSFKNQSEALYHQILNDPEKCAELYWEINLNPSDSSIGGIEISTLTDLLLEQVDTHRVDGRIYQMLYWRKGVQQYKKYNPRQALKSLTLALEKAEHTDDFELQAFILAAMGDVLQVLNRMNEAIENYRRAIGFFRKVGEPLGEAKALKAIGDVLQFLGQRDEALENYEKAIGLFRKVEDRLGEAKALTSIGDLFQFLGQRDEALENYEKAIGLFRKVEDRLGEAKALTSVGDLLQTFGRRSQAMRCYDRAIDLLVFQEIGEDWQKEASIFMEIGNVLQFLQQMEGALENYEKARNLFHETGNYLGEAKAYMAIGQAQQYFGKTKEAFKIHEKALFLFREFGDRLGEANAIECLGSLIEDKIKALEYYQAAHQIYAELGDRYSQGQNLRLYIADAQIKLEMIDSAIDSLQEAANIYDDMNLKEYKNITLSEIEELRSSDCNLRVEKGDG